MTRFVHDSHRLDLARNADLLTLLHSAVDASGAVNVDCIRCCGIAVSFSKQPKARLSLSGDYANNSYYVLIIF